MTGTQNSNGKIVDSGALGRRSVEYVALTFAISLAVYLPIIASDRGLLSVEVPAGLAAVGVLSPGIAALLLTARRRGTEVAWDLLGGLTRRRFGPRWWAATLLGPPGLIGAAYGTYLVLGGSVEQSSTVEMLGDAGAMAVVVLPIVVLVTLALALGEEVGWRGYLLPILQSRFSALGASLVLGVLWFLWHVPLAYLPEGANAAFPFPLWGASIVSLSVVYTWLFNNTGGSLLAVTLFHGGLNVWGGLVALHPSETGETISAVAITGTQVLLALVLVVAFGAATLSGGATAGPPHSDSQF